MIRWNLCSSAVLVLGVSTGTGCVMTIGETPQHLVRVEKRFQVTGVPDLSLVTFDGSIEVRASDHSEIVVEIEKRAIDQAEADEIEVKVEQSGSRILVEARRPARGRSMIQIGTSPTARLIASVPSTCNLVARTGDGSVTVEHVTGSVEIDSGDGSIKAVGLVGKLRAHTEDGTVRIEDINGALDADTGDGSVTVQGRLTAVRLLSGDGSVSVRADRGSAMSADWEVRTGDGGVTIELPADFNADLDAHAVSGSVRVEDLPILITDEPGARDAGAARGTGTDTRAIDQDREGRRRTLRGRLNNGGPTLKIRTGDGAIKVRRS